MNKLIAVLISTVLFVGCSSNKQFGNFTEEAEKNHIISDTLALDISKQISNMFAPAKTKFQFTHDNEDSLGIFLQQELRLKGFAVSEFNPKATKAGKNLSYILDKYSEEKLLIRVYLDNHTITRLYQIDNKTIKPVTAWTLSKMEEV